MIVHVITGLRRGGAESALCRLLSDAPQPGRFRVVSLTDGGHFQAQLEALGIEVVCLQMGKGWSLFSGWWRLARMLRAWRPDLVQTWMYHADLFGGIAAFAAGVPVSWGVRHSDLSRDRNKMSTLLVARACALISRWIPARAISCSTRGVAVHRALGYRVPFEVVPNGLDVEAWAPKPGRKFSIRAALGIPAGAFVIAHAGRKHPMKDHHGLALAFNRLHGAVEGAYLLLCGNGLSATEEYFQLLPFSPSAREAVVALGPRDDLPELWQAADVFVLSSSEGEGFPNAVVEAMSCALPCVVTDVGDAAEIVADTGIVVEPGNHDALADSLCVMAGMGAEERERLGALARSRVQAHFTLARMTAGFDRVWAEILQMTRRRCAD